MLDRRKFWMVLGAGAPTFRHYNGISAFHEAERLAKINPGHSFTVLESKGTVVKGDVTWVVTDEASQQSAEIGDVPF